MKTITLILIAFCALCAFAQTKTDPLDSQLKKVYRNKTYRTDGVYQRWKYRAVLSQKLSETSGIFNVFCDEEIITRRERLDRTNRRPQIVIINCGEISDMAAGDTIELNDKQTLWGLGTITLWTKNKQKKITLRQFSFRRKDALAYLAAKKTANHVEICPTCGQPMPKNY